MYSETETVSVADAINQVTTIMAALKAWFDDNGVEYAACDLIDSVELVMEAMESED
jgi:hypothetical protein